MNDESRMTGLSLNMPSDSRDAFSAVSAQQEQILVKQSLAGYDIEVLVDSAGRFVSVFSITAREMPYRTRRNNSYHDVDSFYAE